MKLKKGDVVYILKSFEAKNLLSQNCDEQGKSDNLNVNN